MNNFNTYQERLYNNYFLDKESKSYVVSLKEIQKNPAKFFPTAEEMEANNFDNKKELLNDLLSRSAEGMGNIKFASHVVIEDDKSDYREIEQIYNLLDLSIQMIEDSEKILTARKNPKILSLNSASAKESFEKTSLDYDFALYQNFNITARKIEINPENKEIVEHIDRLISTTRADVENMKQPKGRQEELPPSYKQTTHKKVEQEELLPSYEQATRNSMVESNTFRF